MIFSLAVWLALTSRGRTQIDVGSPSGTRFLSIPNRISPGHRRERVGSADGSPRFGREDAAPARTIATDLAIAANCSPFAAPENRDLNPPSGLSQAFHHSITGSSPARVATGRWVLIASLQAPVPAKSPCIFFIHQLTYAVKKNTTKIRNCFRFSFSSLD
jgi:hypothetical protein